VKHLSRTWPIILLVFTACSSQPENPLDVDVSEVELSLEIERWDEKLHNAGPDGYKAFATTMSKENPQLWPYYVEGVLNLGDPKDPMFVDNFNHFLSQEHIQLLITTLEKDHPSIDSITVELSDNFKHLKYYFPEAPVPKIVFINGFFNRSVWATENAVFVALDYYLGNDHWMIKGLPGQSFFDYIKIKMDVNYLAADVMHCWLQTHVLEEVKFGQFGTPEFEGMLEAIIYYGKLQYALEAMLPNQENYKLMRYLPQQMNWALSNEEKVWVTMVDRDLIHSTNKKNIDDYFNEGPFTPGLKDNDSPDRIGVFIGARIVKDYMTANSNVSLSELLQETNEQKILNAYNPAD